MYFRKKTSAGRTYLQIVESRREGDQVRQQVIATLGRYEELQASGQLERLLRSGARFASKAMVLSAVADDSATKIASRRIGPALVFERLWEETGCLAVIEELAATRKHGFALERAVFLTVLHRLFVSGSDRAADRWREDYRIAGIDGLDLHHLYRAMAWLGEELAAKDQDGRTPFAPRCRKDVVEERLFAHRRDLFTRLDLVFMDTTSLYFEGAGGQTLGRHGYSKDHRPDLRQMILAVVIDGDGRPVCSEMWPGNTADVTTLIPVVDRLSRRFAIARVCVVADRGLISAETLAELEARRLLYILGVRERSDRLVRKLVLDDTQPLVPLVIDKRGRQVDYEAKAVVLAGRRYIVCRNHQEAEKMKPTVPQSSPRSSASSPKAARRSSATPATAASSRQSAPITSPSTRQRSKRTSASTASSCCAPTPTSIRSKPCCATSSCGPSSRPSELPSTCFKPVRSSTSSTRPFAVTCSQASWRWCSRRRWRIASPHSDAQARGPTSWPISIR